jgi:hypothetical protein
MQGQRQEVRGVPGRWPLNLYPTPALLLRYALTWNFHYALPL